MNLTIEEEQTEEMIRFHVCAGSVAAAVSLLNPEEVTFIGSDAEHLPATTKR